MGNAGMLSTVHEDMNESTNPTVTTPPMAAEKTGATNYAQRSGKVPVTSRFGPVVLDYDKSLSFEEGILGIPNIHRFCLLPFPVEKFPQFMMLHALDDDSLSFVTLPIQLDNPMIAKQDLLDVAQEMDVLPQNLAIILIVNVYKEDGMMRISANARAPIFIDTKQKKAQQVVLRNKDYQVRTMLQGALAKPSETAQAKATH